MTVSSDGEYRIAVNGIVHWCRVAGARHQSVPLVIIHGGPGGNNYTFERTIGPRLEQLTTVIYYEQRGCGRSEAPADPEAYSLPLLVADLEALRQAWGQERIIPLGYSFGGEVALEYALTHPDRVSKLIVQAPGVGDPDQIAYVQLAGFTLVARGEVKPAVQQILAEDGSPRDRLAKAWQAVDRETVDRFLFHNRDAARLNRQLWQESGLVNMGQMERALAHQPRSSPSLRERLPLVRVPTLVMVGLYDRNSGVDVNRDVATLIPHAELALFAQSAHFPDMEEPDRYAATIKAFIKTSSGRSGVQ